MPAFDLSTLLTRVKQNDPEQIIFQQAVEEVFTSLVPFLNTNPKYAQPGLLERMIEPERVILFRVPWVDDRGIVQVNRGYRVQMSSAIGPYKGGLRFHPTVNLDILKFLGFEQTFKNALTTLPMGGGKGGANFDPKGKSDNEVMRFCQSFMTELYRHIGAQSDIPAGDMGVGAREIGYMYGQYKRIRNEFTGTITGKNLEFGGSLIRPEATGYGLIYFVENMLTEQNQQLAGKQVVISGSGNVAQYAAEKLIQLDAKVLTLSDSGGFIYYPSGMTSNDLAMVFDWKNIQRGRLSEFARMHNIEFHRNSKPWQVACDIALPCATQNELNKEDAETLVKNGCYCVAEGANMPSTNDAIQYFVKTKTLYAPGKASNAGGVATSGLEMSQNAIGLSWDKEKVNTRLRAIMDNIFESCLKHGKSDDYNNYMSGANIAGFKKVADAMIALGVV